MDIVGPLKESEGYRYVLTMVDRYSRWVEAVPMTNIEARTVAKHFIETWISRFGVPAIVTTDRGLLFQSQLFRELGDTFGIKHIQTSAYNPRANEIVERFHRQMKDALRAKSSDLNWHQDLPLILLSIRCSNKEDLGYSPAKMTYGQELRFPPDPYQLEHRVQPVEDFIRALTKSIQGQSR